MSEPFIAKTTIKKGNVKIGEDSKIWDFCNIYGTEKHPVIIGKNTQIGTYSEIKPGVIIGDNCRFQSYIFIPEGTKIGNYVFIGPGVKFANDKYPTAEKAINGEWTLEASVVEDHAVIGLGALIAPGIKIGEYAVVGLGSVVFKNVNPYTIIMGNPAQVIGDVRSERFRHLFDIPRLLATSYFNK